VKAKTDFLDLANDYLVKCYANLKNNNVNLPLLLWVSAWTRLLAYNKNKGEVLPHVWHQGRAEIGKSYPMDRVVELLPEGAVVKYRGASPKLFTRDKTDLRHRIAYFEEADSLAQGEENPMAESFRKAMDSGDFIYQSLNNIGGRWEPETFTRPGPFVMWSTSLKNPGTQLRSRMAVIAMPEPDAKAIADRNLIKNAIDKDGWPIVSNDLLHYQEDLQKQAAASDGIKVSFNDETFEVINKLAEMHIDSRAFSQIKFLLKALALMAQRTEVLPVDYDTLFDLNRHSEFLTSGLNSGVTGGIRKICDAISEIKKAEEDDAARWFDEWHPVKDGMRKVPVGAGKLAFTRLVPDESVEWLNELRMARQRADHSKITSNDLAAHMDTGPTTAQEWLKAAIAEGWVENQGFSKAKADYKLGPLFKKTLAGLPSRDVLMGTVEPTP